MKKLLLSGMTAFVLAGGIAHADNHLIYPPGEGAFNWGSYEAFAAANDFSGQELTNDRSVDRRGQQDRQQHAGLFRGIPPVQR